MGWKGPCVCVGGGGSIGQRGDMERLGKYTKKEEAWLGSIPLTLAVTGEDQFLQTKPQVCCANRSCMEASQEGPCWGMAHIL